MLHYKRARRYEWVLPPEDERRVGDPDGYGRYGILERDYQAVRCHECGGWYAALGYHLLRTHEMTPGEYRAAHGLPRGMALICERVREALSASSTARLDTPGWRRFEAARDPQAASEARDLGNVAPAVRASRIADGPTRLPKRPPRAKTCPICGETYTGRQMTCGDDECYRENQARKSLAIQQSRRPHLSEEDEEALQRATGSVLGDLIRRHQQAGVSSAEIGRAIQRSGAWMTAHFPAPSNQRSEGKNAPTR